MKEYWSLAVDLINRIAMVPALALGLAVACILTASDDALPDQSMQIPAHIGVVAHGPAVEYRFAIDAFRGQLKTLGYAEGSNLRIEERWANGDATRLSALVADLVQRKIDVIVVDGTHAARAAKQPTSTVPIVMVVVADPVGSGLVANLAHPEDNLTGLSLMTIDLSAKRLQLLKDAIPQITRAAVLWNPDHPFHSKVVDALKLEARSLSMQLTFVDVRTPEQFGPAFSAVRRARAQGLYVIEDPFFYIHRGTISELSTRAGLPTMYGARQYVDVGGLMSYGPQYEDLWRRAAGYVDKILKGAKPGELPIEQPTKFELIVNLKTAKTLGIKIPESILARADEVIK